MSRILVNTPIQRTRLFIFLILCALSTAHQYTEGDFCDFASYNGTCLRGSKCFDLPALAQALGLTQRQIGHCGYTKFEEIICCPLPAVQSPPKILDEFKPYEFRPQPEHSISKPTAGLQKDAGFSNVDRVGDNRNVSQNINTIFHKNIKPLSGANGNERINFTFSGEKALTGNANERLNQLLNRNVQLQGNAGDSPKGSNVNPVRVGNVRQRMQSIPIESNDVANNVSNNGERRPVGDSNVRQAQVPLEVINARLNDIFNGTRLRNGNILLADNGRANTLCETRQYNGTCKAKSQCTHSAATLADIGLNDNDVTHCGQEDIICCPNIERPAVRACRAIEGRLMPYQGEHIFGGHKVSATEYPFMAYIVYDREGFICGGTLIHTRYVLTAAHCVIVADRKAVKVILGIANLNDPGEARYRQEIDIKKTIEHEKYSSQSKYFDIAVIELTKDVKYGLTVYPTCLHTNQTELPDGTVLTVAGWGITENYSPSEHLLAVQLNKVSLSHCNQSYAYNIARSINHGIENSQLCAIAPGKDSCHGDSGGPLLLAENATYNSYRVVGVVSFGGVCGGSLPGVYTRVSEFLNFIEAIVWSQELH